MAVLNTVHPSASEMALMARIAELEAQAAAKTRIFWKINAKGTKNKLGADNKGNLSVYGLNAQFPVTLYANQWLKLFDVASQIKADIETHRAELSWK